MPSQKSGAANYFYWAATIASVVLGLFFLAHAYVKLVDFTECSAGVGEWVAFAGYTLACAGVLVCILIWLVRWRSTEDDDGRRPNFTAGVAILAVGAALMIAAVMKVPSSKGEGAAGAVVLKCMADKKAKPSGSQGTGGGGPATGVGGSSASAPGGSTSR
jgi:hypothetical protein